METDSERVERWREEAISALCEREESDWIETLREWDVAWRAADSVDRMEAKGSEASRER